MNIAVLCASRNNPAGLETTIRVLQMLASGKHDISYILGLDDDDPASIVRMQNVSGVTICMGPRPLTIGEVWNRCANQHKADIYFLTGDDYLCLSENWDDITADINLLSFSGSNSHTPGAAVWPIMSRQWVDATGYVFPEHFPFWFNDTWWQEIYEYATGEPMMIAKDILFSGQPGQCRGMNELDFWWGFYNATRDIRIADALCARARLNILPKSIDKFVEKWDNRDRKFKARIPELEKHYTITPNNSPQYRLAKLNAEDYLKKHNLTLWQRLCSM